MKLLLLLAICYCVVSVPLGKNCANGNAHCGSDLTTEKLTCEVGICKGRDGYPKCNAHADCAAGIYCDLNSVCRTCPSGCSSCTSNTTCTGCNTGFYLNSTTGTCNSGVANCLEGNSTNCTRCAANYTVSVGACVKCTDSNALSCPTNASISATCISGYFVNTTTSKCDKGPDNCVSPSSATSCTYGGCQGGYYTYNATGGIFTCVKGKDNCDVVYNVGACKTCATGYYKTSELACTQITITGCDTSDTGIANCTKCQANHLKGFNCSGVVTSCAIASSATTCDTCNAGFFKTTTSTCTACVSNCATCTDATSATCTACSTGYFYLAGYTLCTACFDTTGTATCTTALTGTSLTCKSGYSSLTTGTCTACNANCASCSTNARNCLTCKVGYALNGTSCLGLALSAAPAATTTCDLTANCKTCSNAHTCSVCKDSFWLDTATGICGGSACVANCKVCASAAACTTCADNAYFVSATTCTPCTSPCATCSTSATNCLTCIAGSFQTGASCAAAIANCKVAASGTACTTCDDGYFPLGTPAVCTANTCLANCALCTSASTCTKCKDGFFFTAGSPPTCTGTGGQTDPTGACVSFCKECASASTCTTCVDGRFKNGANCDACSLQCATCVTSASNCLTCKEGSLLANGKCFGNLNTPLIANCKEFNTDLATCKTCTDAHYGSAGSANAWTTCATCDASCKSCSATGTSGCTACRDGYTLSANPGTCTIAVPANCKAGANTSHCTQCNDEFYWTGSACAAVSGSANLTGCLVVNGLGINCTTCKEGYFAAKQNPCVQGSTATPGLVNCVKFATQTTCDTCGDGYYKNTNSLCAACSVSGCKTCNADASKCETCKATFNKTSDTACTACGSNADSCPSATANGTIVCSSGYANRNGTCERCNDTNAAVCDFPKEATNNTFISGASSITSTCIAGSYKTDACASLTGCTEFYSPNKCKVCADGYFLDLTSYTCSACGTGCSKCTTNSTYCQACTFGYVLNSTTSACLTCSAANATSCNCATGTFYDSSKACSACSTGCLTCTNASTCTTCRDAYFLGTTACTACATGCKTCSSATACSICLDNYYLDNGTCKTPVTSNCAIAFSVSICKTCSLGFYYSETSGGCADCSAITNCKACTPNGNSSTCTLCATGYTLYGNTCSNCTLKNCATCSTNDTCDLCIAGYYYNTTASTTKQCLACQAGCSLCGNSTSCARGSCMSGYRQDLNNLSCVACPTGCATCNTAGICQTCSAKFFLEAVSGTNFTVGGKCTACDASCGTCNGTGASNCSTCIDNASPAKTTSPFSCTCNSGYGFNSTTGTCDKGAPSSSAATIFTGLLTILVILLAL